MANKKNGGNKGFFSNIKDGAKKFYDYIKSEKIVDFIKEEARQFFAKEFKDSLIDVVRREIRELKIAIIKSIAFGIFLFAGIVMIIVGLAELLAKLYPALSGGLNYMIFGIVFIIVALVIYYKKDIGV